MRFEGALKDGDAIARKRLAAEEKKIKIKGEKIDAMQEWKWMLGKEVS